MAIVGMPSVFPLSVARAADYGVIHGTDQFYLNVDSDGFYEIAIGRIVGGDASYATLGESLYLMNVLWYNQASAWDRYGLQCYGDPAMSFYRPQTTPQYKPTYVSGNGKNFTVHAPETYWVDHVEHDKGLKGPIYSYSAPGMVTTPYEPDRMLSYFARYKTPHEVRKVTQESVPSHMGWVQKRGANYQVDEHYDGTRTIWMKVRLDEFDIKKGICMFA